MSKQIQFPHLMGPVKVGSLLLKNHMIATCCLPHFLQGSENFPSESIKIALCCLSASKLSGVCASALSMAAQIRSQ